MRKLYPIACIVFALILSNCSKEHVIIIDHKGGGAASKIDLGREIFFDQHLSNPIGQSCSSCHSPATAFSDPNNSITSPGAVKGLFGSRNAPVVLYASFIPPLHYSPEDTGYKGGLFLDGRATSLEDQAKHPFFNPIEMNLSDTVMLVQRILNAPYYDLFRAIYGNTTNPTVVLNDVADAIATFERSDEFKPFTSKFDYYLAGKAKFTSDELAGLQLFNDTNRAKCSTCHLSSPDDASGKIMFTDFTYNSDGVPRNPNNPFYTIPLAFNPLGANFIDSGLVKTTHDETSIGQFRVPTLRNIAISGPYFHNGFFSSLDDVVHFYNTRDLGGFPPPEIPVNVDSADLGNLHLTPKEEKQIVAFLNTLTDGYK